MKYRLAAMFGRILAGLRYASTSRVEANGKVVFRRQRRPLSERAILIGNWYLRMQRAGTRVLPRQQWLERERTLYLHLYDKTVEVDSQGSLMVPAFEGLALADLLQTSGVSSDGRFRAVSSAAAALGQLHCTRVAASGGSSDLITHGDATVDNVVLDPQGGVARWIDFDMIYTPDATLTWRRADDLRALIDSAAALMDADQIPMLVQSVMTAYHGPEVWQTLYDSVLYRKRRPIPFHLAQSKLSRTKWDRLHSEILAANRSQ